MFRELSRTPRPLYSQIWLYEACCDVGHNGDQIQQLCEVEHQQQSILHRTEFLVRKVTSTATKRTGVNGAGHLTENLRYLFGNSNFGVKAGRERRA